MISSLPVKKEEEETCINVSQSILIVETVEAAFSAVQHLIVWLPCCSIGREGPSPDILVDTPWNKGDEKQATLLEIQSV